MIRVTCIVLTFLVAVTAANLIVTADHDASILTALALIGPTFVLRDLLHDALTPGPRIAVMALLVLAGSTISYVLNADAQMIAIASAVAFAVSLTSDAITYQAVRRLPWFERSNISNLPGAAFDSALFVLIAFDGFPWQIAVAQFGVKVAGGVVLAAVVDRVVPVAVYPRRATA